MSTLKVSIGYASKAGRKDPNQDCVGSIVPEGSLLEHKGIAAVVADGVSACADGALASHTACRSFLEDYYATPDTWRVRNAGERVIGAINTWLYNNGAKLEGGLATTFSAIVLKSTTAHIMHSGDSRIQLFRANQLECLTRDHRRGGGYLTHALGVDPALEMDYSRHPLEAGDLFMLSSDGVHDFVDTKRISAELQHAVELQACAENLVQQALDNNSPDNLSCLLLKVEQVPTPDADETYRRLSRLPFPPSLMPGMRLDGYVIERELHASPRSQLHLASSPDNQQVVIKTPSPNFSDDESYIEAFLLEEWIGQRVDSPYVARCYPAPKSRQFLYLLMEYVPGKTLESWIAENPKPDLDQTRDIIQQIAKGLQALHRREMLHRDLKPDNVIMLPNGHIKIVDFGAVKVAGMGEINTLIQRPELQGTRMYSAPEYLIGQSGDYRADLYSLGTIAYELFSGGHLPYGDEPPARLSARKLHTLKYRSALLHNAMLPVWMDGAVEKAVKPDLRQRYAELSEFIYDLEHPNPAFMDNTTLPVLEGNPVRFWQALAGLSLLINIVLAAALLS